MSAYEKKKSARRAAAWQAQKEVETEMSSMGSYRSYRKRLSRLTKEPVIPFMYVASAADARRGPGSRWPDHHRRRPCHALVRARTHRGVILSDLTFIEDGNPDFTEDGMVNWTKRTMLYGVLSQFVEYQRRANFRFAVHPSKNKLLASLAADQLPADKVRRHGSGDVRWALRGSRSSLPRSVVHARWGGASTDV